MLAWVRKCHTPQVGDVAKSLLYNLIDAKTRKEIGEKYSSGGKHFSLGIYLHLLHKVTNDPKGKLCFFVLDVESANHAMREVRLNNGAVDRQAQNIHHSRSDNR